MPYSCLICSVILDSPHKLEVHLQIEHKWEKKEKEKKEPKGLDTWT
ncbi:hypothetical protein [Nitrosopumilus sp.]|nr:hypothetical protein [Nitrosopumilus sp.]